MKLFLICLLLFLVGLLAWPFVSMIYDYLRKGQQGPGS